MANKGFASEDIARQRAAADMPNRRIYIIESRGEFYVETDESCGGFVRSWEREVYRGLGKMSVQAVTAFATLSEFAMLAAQYREERAKRPDVPAARLLNAIRRCNEGDEVSMDEALCPGHEFVYTGTQYGGDDERWGGEGRCYCVHCGKDGDA